MLFVFFTITIAFTPLFNKINSLKKEKEKINDKDYISFIFHWFIFFVYFCNFETNRIV